MDKMTDAAAAPREFENRLDRAQVEKASQALLRHLQVTNTKKDLLGGEVVYLYLQVHLKKIPARPSNKPVQLRIPHSLLRPEDGVECCVFAHDPSAEFKQKLAAAPVPGFTKVIGVGKLKSHYGQYKERRALVDAYDFFVADERVVRMMPQLLGKIFYDRKKIPVPVRLDRGGWAAELATARDSTYAFPGWGQTMSIRVGRSDMDAAQVTANIMAAVGPAVARVTSKWRGVQAAHLVARDSVALPIYKARPRGVDGGIEVEADEEGEEEEEGEPAAASRFRAVVDEDDEDNEAMLAALDGDAGGEKRGAAAAKRQLLALPPPKAKAKGAAGKGAAPSSDSAAAAAGRKGGPAASSAAAPAKAAAQPPQPPATKPAQPKAPAAAAAQAASAAAGAVASAGGKRRRQSDSAAAASDVDAVIAAAEALPRGVPKERAASGAPGLVVPPAKPAAAAAALPKAAAAPAAAKAAAVAAPAGGAAARPPAPRGIGAPLGRAVNGSKGGKPAGGGRSGSGGAVAAAAAAPAAPRKGVTFAASVKGGPGAPRGGGGGAAAHKKARV